MNVLGILVACGWFIIGFVVGLLLVAYYTAKVLETHDIVMKDNQVHFEKRMSDESTGN